jgi:hypothetical protein
MILRPARDPALWRYFRRRNTKRADLILSDGARDVGYLHVAPSKDLLVVEEWAAPGITPSRIWATLRALAAEAGAAQITGWLRSDQVDARFTRTRRDRAIPMVADLTGRLGLAQLDPEASHFGSIDHF